MRALRALLKPVAAGWCAMAMALLTMTAAAHAGEPRGFAEAPLADAGGAQTDYRIGALDTLGITVFQVKDLTIDKIQCVSNHNDLSTTR